MWGKAQAVAVALALGAFTCSAALAAETAPAHVFQFHPRTRLLTTADRHVVSDHRYVLVWDQIAYGNPGTVTDEQTGRQTSFMVPSGCAIPFEIDPLGGPRVLAACSRPVNSYMLFDVITRSWRSLLANTEALFRSSPDCATGNYNCTATPVAIGAHWIEFSVDCAEHCYSPGYAFQNIETGGVSKAPKDWVVGGHTIPDLDSPALWEKLCSPLVVPKGIYGLPGTYTFFGRFGISGFAINSEYSPVSSEIFLQRCGSRTRIKVDPNAWPLAANEHALLWNVNGISSKFDGLLLPSLRRIVVTGPSTYEVAALSRRHLFFDRTSGGVWETTTPFPPAIAQGPTPR